MNNLKLSGKIYEETFHWSSRFAKGALDSKCLLRLYANNGKIIGIAQSLLASIGGIKTYAYQLANWTLEMYQNQYGRISKEDFLWIEFHPKETWSVWKDNYSLVNFDWDIGQFCPPTREDKSYEEVREIIGMEPPKSLLRDNLYHFTENERKELYTSLSRALTMQSIPSRNRGFLEVDASEYRLFKQTREGHYKFSHPEAKSSFCLTTQGRILFPEEYQDY